MPDTSFNAAVPPAPSMRAAPFAPAHRPRLAIVSSYDEMCGIAGYTRVLEKQLAPYADVTVLSLDQYLVRNKYSRIQRLADAHIREIAAQLKNFDSVNIQLEHGTLGRSARQITRRFRWLAQAAPSLCVTFHTVLLGQTLEWDTAWRLLSTAKFDALNRLLGDTWRGWRMAHGIQGLLGRMQRRKPVCAIVHTGRDARMMRDLHRIETVHHHPLSYLPPGEAVAIRARTSRADFPSLAHLPPQVKLIGTFGFLSPYKGFDTAIRALPFLPEEYHLLIFGGLHPQSIRREETLNPYLQKLLRIGHIGQTPLEELKESGLRLAPGGSALAALIGAHPESLHERIHFMGALPDAQFYAAAGLCDVAVFPYLEVGQASSGAISIALEMGAKVIASRTNAFRALARYHPDMIEFFDIGNFMELATRIQNCGRTSGVPSLRYNTATNAQIYLAANGFAGADEALSCAAR